MEIHGDALLGDRLVRDPHIGMYHLAHAVVLGRSGVRVNCGAVAEIEGDVALRLYRRLQAWCDQVVPELERSRDLLPVLIAHRRRDQGRRSAHSARVGCFPIGEDARVD